VLYYTFDSPLITDAKFDRWAQELTVLQAAFPGDASECEYHELFRHFSGTSEFDLRSTSRCRSPSLEHETLNRPMPRSRQRAMTGLTSASR